MGLTDFLKGTSDSTTEVRNQVELKGEPFKTFKFATDNFEVKKQAIIIEQKNIGGEMLIYGNESFGTWGAFKWGNEASQSFILGLSRLGTNALGDKASEFAVVRILPPNNVFDEFFITDYFIDDETTAELGVYDWI